jgi:hypothetical protein
MTQQNMYPHALCLIGEKKTGCMELNYLYNDYLIIVVHEETSVYTDLYLAWPCN